jgi:hypothetical protein
MFNFSKKLILFSAWKEFFISSSVILFCLFLFSFFPAQDFFQKESSGVSLITVTKADISRDLERSNIYITVLPESKEAQALIDKNSSSIQTFIPRYDVKSVESDTDHVQVYPGVGIGFTPLSASAHSASKADEFKIMPDEALALNPAAGYTGGRGTGNPDNFGKYPVRALMTDVRGEFFPKLGDFDPKTPTQYPLGRTADILENSQYPVGFTGKDEKGYSTTSTRGGVDASPITTSGFTF